MRVTIGTAPLHSVTPTTERANRRYPMLVHARIGLVDGTNEGLPTPWWRPDAANRAQLTQELLAELSDGHPLYGLPVEVQNRCAACDEVLVSIREVGDFGMVHLTWSGEPEPPPYPKFTHTGGFIATEIAQERHGATH